MRRKKQPNLPKTPPPPNPYDAKQVLGGGYYSYSPDRPELPDPQNGPGEPVKPPKRWKRILRNILVTLLVILFVLGAWLGWKFVSNQVKVFGWDGIFSLFRKTKLRGEDEGHVNILLAGNSVDNPGHGGAELTDSIMVVSINTADKTAYMLSIPRDLYVDIPENGYAKINEVYQDGERDKFSEGGYPPGGMGLLEKVVSERLAIPIHYYALVDYAALEQSVNAVGGIDVTIQSSDPRGLYDPSRDLTTGGPLVDLTNGTHKLNGHQALNLARARGSSGHGYGFARSDFSRTEHQRQILLALKEKATSTGTLANPVKMGELFDSFGNNVKTDFNLGEVRRLHSIVGEIPSSSIRSASFNDGQENNLLASYTTRLGQSALVPRAGIDDYSEIQAFVRSLQSTSSAQ